jgi:hypothetical protein
MPTVNNLFRRNRATRIKNGLRSAQVTDQRETVADDLTTIILHPTKGFRRISGKRIRARMGGAQ